MASHAPVGFEIFRSCRRGVEEAPQLGNVVCVGDLSAIPETSALFNGVRLGTCFRRASGRPKSSAEWRRKTESIIDDQIRSGVTGRPNPR